MPSRSLLTFAPTLALAFAACNKAPPPTGGEPAAAAPAAAAPTTPAAAAAPAPAAGDPAFTAAVRRVAGELTAGRCSAPSTYRCAGYDETAKQLDAPGQELAALTTLAALINDKDAAVRQVAGFLLQGSARQRPFVRQPAAITPALADQLIAGLGQLEGYAAARAASVAAWAASLTGKLDALAAAIEKHANTNVAPLAVRNLMAVGRLKGFAKVQHYAKSATPAWIVAALEAPRQMPRWTAEEQAQVCPWALGYLPHADLAAATQAGHLMNYCKHEPRFTEALLAEGRRRVAAGQWEMPYDFPFRDICFGGFFGTDKKASGALCEQNYAFLQGIADNAKVAPKMRARALDWIVYQRRDEKSHALLKRYRTHKLPELAKVAADGMAMLERSYLKKR